MNELDIHTARLQALIDGMSHCIQRLSVNTRSNRALTEFIVATTEQIDKNIQSLHAFPDACNTAHNTLLQIINFTRAVSILLSVSNNQIAEVNATLESAVNTATSLNLSSIKLASGLAQINQIKADIHGIRELLEATAQHQKLLTSMYNFPTINELVH
ncbi:hypothetical protein [Pseudomonas abieticivorans]|uniref:hypothetical protein n=1 Tax=Pseudomonas abieticivorans TaxID=2931382 RepID=UPI0020BFF9C9|nr:hypothetical protein [Pseudomonas sp. PIA16]